MDERPLEEGTQDRAGSESFLKKKLYRPGPLVFLFCLAISLVLGLGYYLVTKETPKPQIVQETQPSPATAKVYEEETSTTMEDKVKQADLAIIETMRSLNMNLAKLNLVDVEIRKNGHGPYHYQVIRIPAVSDQTGFLNALGENLSKRSPEARLSHNGTDEAQVSINDLPTHRLLLKTVPFILPPPPFKGPKLAIVIDDIGEDVNVLKGLVSLDFPVTLAVWPHASHTRQCVDLITRKNRDLIIHFPMEPRGYPKYNPGDDALFINMTPKELRKQIRENLSAIPEAIGVNNHMGSRFTENAPGMLTALTEFEGHGLFFLDSLTTPKSVARKTAAKVGMTFFERDIFLDNVKDASAIIHQLRKAENVARKQGYSIAIGHPYPQTLAALQQWGKARDRRIRLLPLSQMPPMVR